MHPYEDLAHGVIKLAVKDYRKALRRRQRNPEDMNARRECRELRAFFRSVWFATLTDLDGEMLMRKIEKQARKRKAAA